VTVIHARVNEIPPETDVVIAHQGLAERARKAAPQAVVLSFTNFLSNTASDLLIRRLTAGETVSGDGAG
jgi:mannitol-specific phosphotransferase system IIBC component